MINIKFTPIPTSLIYTCDGNCLKLVSLLINKESYWKSKGKLDNGFFFMTIEDISKSIHLSQKTINQSIEGLYRKEIIEVISEGTKGKRYTNRFRINWNKINDLDKLTIEELCHLSNQINSSKRKDKLNYRNKVNAPAESVPEISGNTESSGNAISGNGQNALLYTSVPEIELRQNIGQIVGQKVGQNALLLNNSKNNKNSNNIIDNRKNINIEEKEKNNNISPFSPNIIISKEKEITDELEENESEIIESNDSEIIDSNKQDNSDNNKNNNLINNQISMDKKDKNSFEVISTNVMKLCNKLKQINDLDELVAKAQMLCEWLDNKRIYLSEYELIQLLQIIIQVYQK